MGGLCRPRHVCVVQTQGRVQSHLATGAVLFGGYWVVVRAVNYLRAGWAGQEGLTNELAYVMEPLPALAAA